MSNKGEAPDYERGEDGKSYWKADGVGVTQKVPMYARAPDGKMYKELEAPNAGSDGLYEEAEAGLDFVPAPGREGMFLAARDAAEFARQMDGASHRAYFERLAADPDPRAARRAMKRQDAFQKQFERLALDRVVAPSGPKVEVVTDEKFLDLRAGYMKAQAEGKAHESEFQPLNTYVHKLTTSKGKVIRPLYQGEVGMRGSTVVVLEAGYGVGSMISVPK